MEGCRFNDPEYLALYHDGALDEKTEKVFTEHLLTCEECAEALFNLERDLALMEMLEYRKLPAAHSRRKTVFCLISEGIDLVKTAAGWGEFTPFVLHPARGGTRKVFRCEREGIRIDIGSDTPDRFTMEISGVRGKRLTLFRDKRVVEARTRIREERILFHDLERGRYSLSIDGGVPVEFVVE
jgi:hypothetical protein